MDKTSEMERRRAVSQAAQEVEEGAITFVEFVRWCASKVTEEDVREHNANAQDGKAAQWPFQG